MNDPDIGSGSIGYLLFPFDLIPDFIPLIGHLYDMIIVPALVFSGSENDTQRGDRGMQNAGGKKGRLIGWIQHFSAERCGCPILR